ncbi:unnamed protein product, partial [Polarella glacialis]
MARWSLNKLLVRSNCASLKRAACCPCLCTAIFTSVPDEMHCPPTPPMTRPMPIMDSARDFGMVAPLPPSIQPSTILTHGETKDRLCGSFKCVVCNQEFILPCEEVNLTSKRENMCKKHSNAKKGLTRQALARGELDRVNDLCKDNWDDFRKLLLLFEDQSPSAGQGSKRSEYNFCAFFQTRTKGKRVELQGTHEMMIYEDYVAYWQSRMTPFKLTEAQASTNWHRACHDTSVHRDRIKAPDKDGNLGQGEFVTRVAVCVRNSVVNMSFEEVAAGMSRESRHKNPSDAVTHELDDQLTKLDQDDLTITFQSTDLMTSLGGSSGAGFSAFGTNSFGSGSALGPGVKSSGGSAGSTDAQPKAGAKSKAAAQAAAAAKSAVAHQALSGTLTSDAGRGLFSRLLSKPKAKGKAKAGAGPTRGVVEGGSNKLALAALVAKHKQTSESQYRAVLKLMDDVVSLCTCSLQDAEKAKIDNESLFDQNSDLTETFNIGIETIAARLTIANGLNLPGVTTDRAPIYAAMELDEFFGSRPELW